MKLRRSSIAISLACGILASGTVAAAQTQNPSQTEVSAKASDLSFQSTSTLLTDAILPHELQAGQPITVSFQKPAAMMLAQSPPDLAPDPKPTEGSPVPKTDSVFPSADEVVPKSINPGRDTRSGASYVGVGVTLVRLAVHPSATPALFSTVRLG
ncbi:MAG: hypothetical protein HC790_03460 [Acaryochloridaceae cyanobacterium CSU_3_4]|nr:hypothetical protein [Acaryochloridaceae cyanobacterium CSU_3_4]